HEKTKEAMLGEWFNPDDKFFVDEEGFFFYVGRSNDMLKVGGIWVSPIEVGLLLNFGKKPEFKRFIYDNKRKNISNDRRISVAE
ncbi:MAG: hypothetical protein JRE64_25885, partial [Deltaproteobacteria bacterium]|nr:hypothetical protein [Deltaproteobacteria bacterium]